MENELLVFCKNFNIVDNALDMRDLQRWNGRALRNKENLSEHTHLVVACASELYDKLKSQVKINYENLIKKALLHDALEILRGDILSITKDAIPGLRDYVDNEEKVFIETVLNNNNDDCEIESDLVRVADVMACFKFMKREFEFPSNRFVYRAYHRSKFVLDTELSKFCIKYNLKMPELEEYNASNCGRT